MKNKQPTEVTREDLYKQVWETPMTILSKQYGLSDRGLAKICARMKIPVPGRGYWARKAAGKHVIQYKLPTPDPDTELKVRIIPTPPQAEIPPVIKEKLDSLATKTDLTIPEKLTSPHPVIKAWLDENRRNRQEARNDFQQYGISFRSGRQRFTAIERLQHRILNVLFKTLQKHGFIIKSEHYQQAYLEYDGIRIDYSIREKQKQIRRPLTKDEKRYDDRPWKQELQLTGKLVFTIKTWIEQGLKKEWIEKDDNPLENSLPEIINTLIVAAPLLVEERKKRQEEERIRQEEQHRQYLEEQARKKDWNQWRRFMEFSAQWEQANKVNNFISALEALNIEADELIAEKTVAEWLKWAKEWIKTYNPLLNDIETMFESISQIESWTYND